MNKLEKEIESFVENESSIIQKGNRYNADIRYLLKILKAEQNSYILLEERNRKWITSSNASSLRRLDLLDDIMGIIGNCCDNSLYGSEKYETFEIINPNSQDGVVLGRIIKLLMDYYQEPCCCCG